MNDVLDQEFKKAKEVFTKTEKKVLEMVIKKEEEVHKIQQEIGRILKENNLNEFDVDKYKHDKNFEKFQKIKLP